MIKGIMTILSDTQVQVELELKNLDYDGETKRLWIRTKWSDYKGDQISFFFDGYFEDIGHACEILTKTKQIKGIALIRENV